MAQQAVGDPEVVERDAPGARVTTPFGDVSGQVVQFRRVLPRPVVTEIARHGINQGNYHLLSMPDSSPPVTDSPPPAPGISHPAQWAQWAQWA